MAGSWEIEQLLLTIFSFLGFFVSVVPLVLRYPSWNTGSVLYVSWTGIQCLNQFINLVVWHNNVRNVAPVWCEISIRIRWIAVVGIVCAGLLISRMVCKIIAGSELHQSRRQKLQAHAIEWFIGLGPPAVQLIIMYFLQDHRYDIYERHGCMYSVSVTWLWIVLYGVWPVLIGIMSGFYCLKSLYILMQRRKDLRQLSTDNPQLSFQRYLRLSIMALSQIACVLPLSIFAVIYTVPGVLSPYAGFKSQHAHYNTVNLYTLAEWLNMNNGVSRTIFETTDWLYISSALGFFIIFCFSKEAQSRCSSIYQRTTAWMLKSDISRGDRAESPVIELERDSSEV